MQSYSNEWNKIRRAPNTITPRLEDEDGEPSRWTRITYERIGTERATRRVSRKMFFKVDPQRYNSQLDKRRKKAKFWSENNPHAHHNDEQD